VALGLPGWQGRGREFASGGQLRIRLVASAFCACAVYTRYPGSETSEERASERRRGGFKKEDRRGGARDGTDPPQPTESLAPGAQTWESHRPRAIRCRHLASRLTRPVGKKNAWITMCRCCLSSPGKRVNVRPKQLQQRIMEGAEHW
jgi:hypothetical protein